MKRILKFLFFLLLLPCLVFSQAKMGGGISQFTPSLVLDFTQGSMPAGLTFTRNSIATRFNASGVLETVAANQPRFDYDPVTGESKGLLIEESRTNLLVNSDGNSYTNWGNYGAVPIPASFSSGGVQFGYFAVRRVNASGFEGLRRNVTGLTSGTVYTVSVYARKNPSANASNVTISTPAGITATAIAVSADLTTSWKRFSLTFTASATSGDFNFYNSTSNIGDGFDICCFQLEAGTFPTSYIPTTTAAVTRQVDRCTMPVGSWFNYNQGTSYCEFSTFSTSPTSYPGVYAFGVSGNRTGLFLDTRPTMVTPYFVVNVTGFANISISAGTPSFGALLKDIGTYEGSTGATHYLNGGPETLRTSTPFQFSAMAELRLGIFDTALNGYIRKFTYWPQKMPSKYRLSITQ